MEYTLVLSQQEMQVINDALVRLPYYQVAPVINTINKQLDEFYTQNIENKNTDKTASKSK